MVTYIYIKRLKELEEFVVPLYSYQKYTANVKQYIETGIIKILKFRCIYLDIIVSI